MYSPQTKKSFDSKDETSPISQDRDKAFPDRINYENFLRPKTDKVYQFKSRRFDFCRRASHQQKMVMII